MECAMMAAVSSTARSPGVYEARLREMFDQMVVAKDASLIAEYYDPGFVLYTNGKVQGYDDFVRGHERVYETAIAYAVEYDDAAWLESGDRVAARMWITTTKPGQQPTRIEVVLIAWFRQARLYRVWELTWPDWSRLAEFDAYDAYPAGQA
jgi:hypothetical protein